MNKRQKKKFDKQFGSQPARKQNKTERGRLGTMVIPNKKKATNKKECRGKMNSND
jgi:hypothetical protein